MFEIEKKDESRLYDKKIGDQFDGGILGEEFSGCVVEITGGDDYQGFPMVRDYLTKKRVRPLLSKGDVGYRCRRKGVRRRKSVRGAIVSEETCVLSLIIIQPGQKEIEGLTNVVNAVSHLPRTDRKLRAMFGVPAGENVIRYIRKKLQAECGEGEKVPKINHNGKMILRERARREEAKRMQEARRKALNEEREAYLRKYFNKT